MKDKITLIRKQPTPFVVNFPSADGKIERKQWRGAINGVPVKQTVSKEMFDWLYIETSTISGGSLVVDNEEVQADEDLKDVVENIENITEAQESAFTITEIKEILEKGNQNVLKKKLNELIKDKPENLVRAIQRQFITSAGEIGIDSSAKRKVLCDWAGIDFEISDVVFDKTVEDLHS